MTTNDWTISFLGTGGLISQTSRSLPATLVDVDDHRYLFDCGDGTVAALQTLGKLAVHVVAITTVGTSELAGVLTLGEVNRRAKRKPILLAGPPGIKTALEALCSISTIPLTSLFDIVEAPGGAVVHRREREFLEAVPLDVPNGASCGYLLYEAPLPGRVDAKKAEKLGISGPEFSRLLSGETVRQVRPSDVIGPRRLGRRMVISGRGRPTDDLYAALQNSDVAIFAAPFTDDRLDVAEEAGYFTGWEAARLASQCRVKLPVIQRLGPHSRTQYQIAEAMQYNDRLVAPHDGDWIGLPLPERGEPQFHPRTDTSAPAHPVARQERPTMSRDTPTRNSTMKSSTRRRR